MRKIVKVLWIDDGAKAELSPLAIPVLLNQNYEINIANNLSEAFELVRCNEFDIAVVDIRIPMGDNSDLINIYQNYERKFSRRFGLFFLHYILKSNDKREVRLLQLNNLRVDKIGVFSIESFENIQNDLAELNITNFIQKSADMSEDTLLRLIEKLSDNNIVADSYRVE